jgi:DNA invertase Pin-like site-specific DNA recombinase
MTQKVPFIVTELGPRGRIATRTREALAAAKARGQQLGDPEIGQRNRAAADAHAESLREIVTPLAGQTTRAIAKALNDRGIPTPRGGQWQSPQVMRLLDRLGM